MAIRVYLRELEPRKAAGGETGETGKQTVDRQIKFEKC